ncbi:MAG: hypothetical protein ACRER3_06115, partial [Pseudomonas fluorescens]
MKPIIIGRCLFGVGQIAIAGKSRSYRIESIKKFANNTKSVGARLAREEARTADTKASGNKKPHPAQCRAG